MLENRSRLKWLEAAARSEENRMKCVICKTGGTQAGDVTVTIQRGESTVIIKNVPAQVCENCGEYYLSDDISERVLAQSENAVNANTEIEILCFAA
mgnify:CR=1 FL=1